MGHRFTYVVSPEEERENLTVEWFLRRHGYSRHIITGLKRTEDGIFRNGVRLDEPGRARRGCDRNAPCRNRTLRRNSAAAGSVFGCV